MNERATLLEIYADHQTSGAFIAGEGRADWADFDFARARVTMRADGDTIVESIGGHAFTDPFLPLVVLANQMRSRDGLRAGQLLATGSFTGFSRSGSARRSPPSSTGSGVWRRCSWIGEVGW